MREFIQKFDRVVKDILDHLKPSEANILDKFIKAVGGHFTFVLRDKKPSTLAEAKEIAMEVEENIRISKVDINDHPKARTEAKKEKPKDQHKETLLSILKRMENFTKEANVHDRVIMDEIIALERAQKSSYISKGKPFPKKQSEEVRPNSSKFPNTLAPTNVVEPNSSSEDEESEGEESEVEQTDELANLVESEIFNILLGGSYIHPSITEVTLREEKEESILKFDSKGRFKGFQYPQKEKGKDPSTSKEPSKEDPSPKKAPSKESIPEIPPKKDPSMKANPKKDPPRKEYIKKKEKGKKKLNLTST